LHVVEKLACFFHDRQIASAAHNDADYWSFVHIVNKKMSIVN